MWTQDFPDFSDESDDKGAAYARGFAAALEFRELPEFLSRAGAIAKELGIAGKRMERGSAIPLRPSALGLRPTGYRKSCGF